MIDEYEKDDLYYKTRSSRESFRIIFYLMFVRGQRTVSYTHLTLPTIYSV